MSLHHLNVAFLEDDEGDAGQPTLELPSVKPGEPGKAFADSLTLPASLTVEQKEAVLLAVKNAYESLATAP